MLFMLVRLLHVCSGALPVLVLSLSVLTMTGPSGILSWSLCSSGAHSGPHCLPLHTGSQGPNGLVLLTIQPVLGFSREIEPIGDTHTYFIYMFMYEEIYCKELAPMIMEGEKSPSLPSASWRPRRAGGVTV